jgi:transcriptional regulator with XRE-family HTH domain
MDFGQRLRIMRLARGLTQGDVVGIMGEGDRMILSRIESGRLLPSSDLERLLRIALAWGPEQDEGLAMIERRA